MLVLESRCEQLKSDLEKERTETSRLQKMNGDLSGTKQILHDMQSQLEKSKLELGKMEAKNRTLSQHDQVSIVWQEQLKRHTNLLQFHQLFATNLSTSSNCNMLKAA